MPWSKGPALLCTCGRVSDYALEASHMPSFLALNLKIWALSHTPQLSSFQLNGEWKRGGRGATRGWETSVKSCPAGIGTFLQPQDCLMTSRDPPSLLPSLWVYTENLRTCLHLILAGQHLPVFLACLVLVGKHNIDRNSISIPLKRCLLTSRFSTWERAGALWAWKWDSRCSSCDCQSS